MGRSLSDKIWRFLVRPRLKWYKTSDCMSCFYNGILLAWVVHETHREGQYILLALMVMAIVIVTYFRARDNHIQDYLSELVLMEYQHQDSGVAKMQKDYEAMRSLEDG